MRSGRKSQAKKRGHIFKTADKLKFIESKDAFRDLLGQNKILNDKLQEKLNYYYTPYTKKNMNTENPILKFGTLDQNDDEVKGRNKYAKRMWKSIHDYLLSKDSDKTREFLRNINPELYSNLKNFGQQYYLREFKENATKDQFPDIENPRVTISNKEDILLKSGHTEEGIKVLRNEINSRILA